MAAPGEQLIPVAVNKFCLPNLCGIDNLKMGFCVFFFILQ